jgi:hypothetical protein
MVQAAVAGGSSGIDLKLGKNRIEVAFDTKLESGAKDIFELVMRGVLPSDSTLLHLVTGIRASFASPGTSFLLQSLSPEGREIVAISEGESYHHQDRERQDEGRSLTYVIIRPFRLLALKQSLHAPVSQLLKGTAEEHSELVSRCWPSPIPIRIDGKLLQTGYGSPLMHQSSSSRYKRLQQRHQFSPPSVNVYMRYLPPEPEQAILPRPELPGKRQTVEAGEHVVHIRRPVYENETYLFWDTPGEIGGVLLAAVGLHKSGVLCFLHDGVLVQKVGMKFYEPWFKLFGKKLIKIPLAGGECYLHPVSSKDLDLSQFAVRDAAKKRAELMKKILPYIYETDDLFIATLKHFYFIPASEKKSKVAAGLSAGATVPLGFSFGAVGVGAYLFYQLFFFGFQFSLSHFSARSTFQKAYQKSLKVREDFSLDDIEQDPIS